MNRDLHQYFTPTWAAELLVQRHFADLGPKDCVAEPSCGDGRFLMAIPPEVPPCGGRATLAQLYACIEGNRPTANPWWREKVRQIAGKHFHRIGTGEYALTREAIAA
jgi:hypothetical protein